eukprot:XP_011673020.1 PREDICTED: neuropeptide FF receptor 2-like [Strongylocentrotus purpuratus]
MIAGWVIGLTSLIGNLTVLVLRLRQEQQLTVQTLLIMNLAVADCLMGIYMIIITSADIYFGSIYFLSAPIWRESHLCTFSSFLAFLSSECSVFTLALMTVDRFVCIIFPFSGYRLTVKSARISMMLLWLVICMLSVIPNLVPADLPGFYGLSDVCVGLPLHAESKEIGRLVFTEDFLSSGFLIEYVVVESTFRPSWLYAVATFIGVNMILFIIILICYIMMFIQVKRSTQSVANVALRNREIKVARKMAFIVGTDFACWMPIIVMGILTQSGLVVLPTSLYAWSVIFIIPINSSINPVLYLFVNYIENKKKAEQVRTKSKVDERNVRLVDRYDNDLVSEGFVLVYINGTWGTICNVAWGLADSEVTCFELGLSGAVLLDYGSYKPHPDNVMYDVRCVGNETTILDCPSSDVDEVGDCWSPVKAYAYCTNYTIRLTGANFPGEGRVEVFYLGSWRPVCSDNWDLSDGHVACRELGLGTVLGVDHGFISSEEMGDYILNDVRCNGSESRILDCLGSTFSIGKCNSTRSARVRCSDGGLHLDDNRSWSDSGGCRSR